MKKALFSVFDKTDISALASALNALGVEIIATEGTAKALEREGIPVTRTSSLTGFREMLGGKVKTLHPAIHKAIGTAEIGLVAVNFPPLHAPSELDVGGVTLLLSAVRNPAVAILVQPRQYAPVVDELKRRKGEISAETRCKLANEAVEYLTRYVFYVRACFRLLYGSKTANSNSKIKRQEISMKHVLG